MGSAVSAREPAGARSGRGLTDRQRSHFPAVHSRDGRQAPPRDCPAPPLSGTGSYRVMRQGELGFEISRRCCIEIGEMLSHPVARDRPSTPCAGAWVNIRGCRAHRLFPSDDAATAIAA